MSFDLFTGTSDKNTRKQIIDDFDSKEFVENLKHFLDVESEEDFTKKLKNIFADKRRCTLFCKKLGYSKEEFIKLLIGAKVEFIFQSRVANWIYKIHFENKK